MQAYSELTDLYRAGKINTDEYLALRNAFREAYLEATGNRL